MAGFGNAKQLMVDIDFDVSGMKSMSKLSEAIQNGTENLEALEKKLKNATESQENLADATGFSTSQLRAQARAMGKLDALDAAGRSQTAKTEQLSARASDIQNITAEADRLRESQQKIQEFEQVLGQQGLSMDEEGNIKDGNRRLENRGEILQQVMQGQETMQLKENIANVPEVNQQLQNAREASLGASQGLSRYSSQVDDAGNKVMSFMGSTEAMSTTLQQNEVPGFMGEMAGQTPDRQGFRRQMPEPQVGNLGGTMLAMEGLSQNAQAVSSSAGSAADSLRNHMDAANNMQTPAQKTSTMFGNISTNADKASNSYDSVNKSADNTNRQFAEQFGLGMNLMFMGMALQQVFGGLSKKMLKTTGASSALSAGLKSMLLPFFIAITPLIVQLSMAMTQLPKPIKMAAGALTALLAVLGVFLFFGMQVFLLSLELSVGFAALAGSLVAAAAGLFAIFAIVTGVYMIFKKFGPVVGALAAVVGGVLIASIVSAVASLSTFQTMLAGTAIAAYAEAASNYASIAAKYALSAASSVAAAAMSVLTTIISAAAAAFASLNISMTGVLFVIGSLVLGLFLLQRVFKKFGPVVGLLATILGGVLLAALSPIAAIILAIFGAFKAVNKVFKKFGKIAGVIATLIVGVIAVIIGVFASVPVAIGLAIGAAIAFLWNFRDEIMSALNKAGKLIGQFIDNAVNFFKNLPSRAGKFIDDLINKAKNIGSDIKSGAKKALKTMVSFVAGKFDDLKTDATDKVQKIIDFVTNIGQKIKDGATDIASKVADIGKDIIDGIVDGIQNNVDAITDAFKDNLPDWAMKGLKAAGGAIESGANAVGNVVDVNDFIMTDNGQIVQPSPNDTIVGFNGNGPIQPGAGGGGETTVNINDPVMKEEADIERLVDEVEDRVNRDTRGRTGGI